jgi:hypothetical protein
MLEAERTDIAGKLAALNGAAIALHPAALKRYRTDLDHLSALLQHDESGACDDL